MKNKKTNGKEYGKSSEKSSTLCGICMEEKTKAKMFTSIKCGHLFCLDCMGKHAAAKIHQNIINVKCPEWGCNELLEPHNCGSIVPKEVVDLWEVKMFESLLFGWQKIYCPFYDCSTLLVADDEEKVKGLVSLECPNCHRMFCARCKVPWPKCLIENIEDQHLVSLARESQWKRCPNCNFYVERDSGCDKIRCRCGHDLCYNCGKMDTCGHFCRETREVRAFTCMNTVCGLIIPFVILLTTQFGFAYAVFCILFCGFAYVLLRARLGWLIAPLLL
ncbi:hypothetical protein UlMin_000368 [Ulmus minor]